MTAEPLARAHPQPVVLNIGAGLGALVVHWDATRIDTPIEISPTGRDGDRHHQHILERPAGDRTFYAAVFDAIPEGTYTLCADGAARARGVAITGGRVTELNWSATENEPTAG